MRNSICRASRSNRVEKERRGRRERGAAKSPLISWLTDHKEHDEGETLRCHPQWMPLYTTQQCSKEAGRFRQMQQLKKGGEQWNFQIFQIFRRDAGQYDD
jgi:hypothetical protein